MRVAGTVRPWRRRGTVASRAGPSPTLRNRGVIDGCQRQKSGFWRSTIHERGNPRRTGSAGARDPARRGAAGRPAGAGALAAQPRRCLAARHPAASRADLGGHLPDPSPAREAREPPRPANSVPPLPPMPNLGPNGCAIPSAKAKPAPEAKAQEPAAEARRPGQLSLLAPEMPGLETAAPAGDVVFSNADM